VTHFGLRGASFVQAGDYARGYAARYGLTAEGGFFNPGRREGLKLAFLEANDQAPRPIDWYVQAVSSAMGVYGTYKGARELLHLGMIKRVPRLLCVQQESCAPMVRAFTQGSKEIRPEHRVANPAGIAEAILRGDPTRAFPYVRGIVMDSGGGFVAVSETEIRQARALVEDEEGIQLCFSAAAAVAGVIKRAAEDTSLADAMIVVNLTGADRPQVPAGLEVEWISKTKDGWNARPPARRDSARCAPGAN
jgi:threonine synthase